MRLTASVSLSIGQVEEKKDMQKPFTRFYLVVLVLLIAALACNFSVSSSNDNRAATVNALSTVVAATTTAMAEVSAPSMPTLAPQPEIPTMPAQPPVALEPTQPQIPPEDMQATQMAAAMAATQENLGPIRDQLLAVGVDPNMGQLAWIQPKLEVETDQYMGQNFTNQYPEVGVQDFVLSSDITWDTQYGAAGCSFVFRSDGNRSKPSMYMVWMTRLASGRVEFIIFSEGQIVGGKDFYANGIDPAFDGGNGATNRLTVVGRGKNFTVYTNGTKLGTADPSVPILPIQLPNPPQKPLTSDPALQAQYQQALATYNATVARLKAEFERRVAFARTANKIFPAGIVMMGAVAESGHTFCQFKDTWLWHIAPGQ